MWLPLVIGQWPAKVMLADLDIDLLTQPRLQLNDVMLPLAYL